MELCNNLKIEKMGMYDSVLMKVKCPYCGNDDEKELQTKQFSCILRVWRVGDYIDDSVRSFETITECLKKECAGVQPQPINIKDEPYISRFFDVEIFLKRGKITGKYKILPN